MALMIPTAAPIHGRSLLLPFPSPSLIGGLPGLRRTPRSELELGTHGTGRSAGQVAFFSALGVPLCFRGTTVKLDTQDCGSNQTGPDPRMSPKQRSRWQLDPSR